MDGLCAGVRYWTSAVSGLPSLLVFTSRMLSGSPFARQARPVADAPLAALGG